jgi:mono/diheme cytochrome c family protein
MSGELRRWLQRQRSWYWLLLLGIAILAVAGCRRQQGPVKPPPTPAVASAADNDTHHTTEPATAPQPTPTVAAALSGAELYALHCAACHGQRGDGLGLAAAFVFPKPRGFRAEKFHLVSTSNKFPARDDLHAVLLRGMPGSSMPPWVHLSQAGPTAPPKRKNCLTTPCSASASWAKKSRALRWRSRPSNDRPNNM